jgi:hypothetical protein
MSDSGGLQSSAASRNPSEHGRGGWKRPENSQGNGCQGNNPESDFSIPLTNIPPDFGFFPLIGGQGILLDMRDAGGLQRERPFVYEPSVHFRGHFLHPVCSLCNRLLSIPGLCACARASDA